jgi:outer membrane protein assembly factor BamB
VTSTRFVTAIATALISIFILTATLLAQAPDTDRYWAQWRGPRHSGVSPTANPPLEWSETKNVRWKVAIPGRGFASPVVWGDTSAIVWTLDRDTPYVPSPVLVDGILYFLKSNSGILSAVDAKTGTPHYQNQRLDDVPNMFASPVSAQGRIYFPGREGTTLVIKSGPTFEALAKNVLDDGFDASPALVDNEIYLRGYKYLYAIAQQ